jgi:hypothetical protein
MADIIPKEHLLNGNLFQGGEYFVFLGASSPWHGSQIACAPL